MSDAMLQRLAMDLREITAERDALLVRLADADNEARNRRVVSSITRNAVRERRRAEQERDEWKRRAEEHARQLAEIRACAESEEMWADLRDLWVNGT